jgi:hypothetical protein
MVLVQYQRVYSCTFQNVVVDKSRSVAACVDVFIG